MRPKFTFPLSLGNGDKATILQKKAKSVKSTICHLTRELLDQRYLGEVQEAGPWWLAGH